MASSRSFFKIVQQGAAWVSCRDFDRSVLYYE
jgi:hypothetical protein